MTLLNIRVVDNISTRDYFKDMSYRAKGLNWIKNPFHFFIKDFPIDDIHYRLYIISIECIYPNVSYAGYPILIGSYYVWGINWFSWFGIALILSGFFWSKYFYYFMLTLGLRKEGVRSKVKLLSDNKVLKWILFKDGSI